MFLEIYESDHFLSTSRLAQRAALKKTKGKLDILIYIDLLSMLEEGIRGGICHAIPGHVKAYNKYMKGYGKNKKSLYLIHWNVNDLYGREMSRKLPVDGLK